MRENRLSGSEGGGAGFNRLFLPLSGDNYDTVKMVGHDHKGIHFYMMKFNNQITPDILHHGPGIIYYHTSINDFSQ